MTDQMMSISQIAEMCETRGVSVRAFWVEALGGDMTPMPAEDVERVLVALETEDDD